MSGHGDHPTRRRFQVLQKLVVQALVQVQVQALVRALVPVVVVVVQGAVVVVAEPGSAPEYAWEEREVVPAPELAVLC